MRCSSRAASFCFADDCVDFPSGAGARRAGRRVLGWGRSGQFVPKERRKRKFRIKDVGLKGPKSGEMGKREETRDFGLRQATSFIRKRKEWRRFGRDCLFGVREAEEAGDAGVCWECGLADSGWLGDLRQRRSWGAEDDFAYCFMLRKQVKLG